MKKVKFLSIILTIMILISAFQIATVTVSAEGGDCGIGITWDFDSSSGKLTVSGDGDMDNYSEKDRAPWYGKAIKSLEITQGVKTIGKYAFYACTGIEEVEIPSGVTIIGEGAFYGCNSIKKVVLSDTVSQISKDAFRYCSALLEINFPSSVKKIGDQAFGSCTSLKNIETNKGLETIGNNAFYLCSSLSVFDIPSTVTSFGDGVFYYCRNLMKIKIPAGITGIPKEMFGGCESLSSVTIPQSVTSIGQNAFLNCKSLKKIQIPKNVNSIGVGAFYGCEYLTDITIPNGITTIEADTFRNCYELPSINMPESVTAIGTYAFDGCRVLKDVYYYGTYLLKKEIKIASDNLKLNKATWHYVLCEQNGHSPSEEWYCSQNTHYHICEICGISLDEGEHSGGTATLTDKPVCEVCENEYAQALEFITVLGTVKSFGDEKAPVTIQLFAEGSTEPDYEITVTGNNAEFSIADVEPQNYTAVIMKANHATRKYEITVTDRNVTFDAEIHIFGDANGDGVVFTKDYNRLKNHITKTSAITGYDFAVMDMNCDGKINNKDIVLVKRIIKKLD